MKEETVKELKEHLEIFNIESNINTSMLYKRDAAELHCKVCGNNFKRNLRSIKSSVNTPCEYCRFKQNLKSSMIEKYRREPYEYLEELIDYDTPIKVKCKTCGFEDKLSPRNMLSNFRYPEGQHPCKQCSYERNYPKNNISDLKEKLIEHFGEINYEFLDTSEYKSFHSKKNNIKLKCKNCGHEFELSNMQKLVASNFHYCPVCGKGKHDSRPYQERLNDVHNGTIIALEEYVTRKHPIKHKCTVCGYGENGEWISPPGDRLSGRGCPICSKSVSRSKGEKEVENFIKTFYNDEIILNSRTILNNSQEIDIYFPELKIGIEYCGLYWHNQKHKGKNYHKEKYNQSKIQNIRLIQIFEDEWIHKNNIVKDKIKHIMGYNNGEKIYARKCTIKEINSNIKKEFLDLNHIQGNSASSINLGLFYRNQLVSVMTFSKRRVAMSSKKQMSNNRSYELARFASIKDKIIIGGFGKLINYFKTNYHNIADEIVTYADLRWSIESNIYEKIGFEKYNETQPNYFYVSRNDGTKRIHRYNFRKQVIKEKFPEIFDITKTEFEMMDKTEYYRIFDAGNLSYKMKV
jgi:hypothetical protein